jgi:UDP-glucose 4-epimerase
MPHPIRITSEALGSTMRVLVTGGAGFVGSHLVDVLLAHGNQVIALDNLSSGLKANLEHASRDPRFKLVEADLKEPAELSQHLEGVAVVYHFAANPEVRVGQVDPQVHFDENLVSTFSLLESMRKSRDAKRIIFASTSTIYGEASLMPTPEEYGPLVPISTYGASKLGCEALISSYAYTFGLRGLILRFGNVVGSRAQHGIIVDLIKKLGSKHGPLEILGDGTQKKSYLHITDCTVATSMAAENFLKSNRRVDTYNVSSPDQVGVIRIAEIVAEEMGVPCVPIKLTGGVDGGRGWMGDVKVMQLSIAKLSKLGWKPRYNSEQAIRLAAKELAHKA